MEYRFNTPLNGNIAMTYHYHEDAALRRDKSLYPQIRNYAPI